ncbi:MAG: hypothetical protein KY475_14715 [Planctomycetes bacterium]|nr:hypothetical protein [Planctomycetota bacterium]
MWWGTGGLLSTAVIGVLTAMLLRQQAPPDPIPAAENAPQVAVESSLPDIMESAGAAASEPPPQDELRPLPQQSAEADEAPEDAIDDQLSLTAASSPLPEIETGATSSSVSTELPVVDAQEVDHPFLAIHREEKLFAAETYPQLRAIRSRRFEEEHADEIRRAYGDDYETMTAWLNEHPIIKEEFYTALKPEHDRLVEALQLFQTLKTEYPEQIVPYANLAIAIAVTWDEPRRGVYHYESHQRRAKAEMPPDHAEAAANFAYFLEHERWMQGRGQFLPWEFLSHVVNHTTPLTERQWALQNYLPKRAMIGQCYKDVPYDTLMLDSQSEQARMNGAAYTLANLDVLGGVCAHQADYASRVSKSLGVPAAYVSGENAYGDLHAWVMWVEIKAVSATSILFTLESHGRYRGDKYYVGHLSDPQTGQRITDRQLELRLHTVGNNAIARRHAALAMEAFPTLRRQAEMDLKAQFQFLNQVIKLCPGYEAPWKTLAQMTRDGEIDADYRKDMLKTLDNLFATYSAFPDLTWEVFDDLTAFEPETADRVKLYQRLASLYVAAERPDLACEAVLRLTDYLVELEQVEDAAQSLAVMIKSFPGEGRYVPRMLDRLEEVCASFEEAGPLLLAFYRDFLPLIPQMRGDRPSPYCISMFERGVQRFQQAGQLELAQVFAGQLVRIRAGQGVRQN